MGADARSWGVVYLANVLGAGSVAAHHRGGRHLRRGAMESVVATAAAKAGLPFLTALLRGAVQLFWCHRLRCVKATPVMSARLEKLFKKLGAIVTEIDISTEAYSTIQSVFEEADVIYFTGGNSFFLWTSSVKRELMAAEKGIGKWKIDDR